MDELDILTIGKRSAHGILALISRTFFLSIISFVSSLVIFTVLTPLDLGIYTAAIAGQRIISFFTDFGFGAALIQKKESLEKKELKTVFSVQVIATLFLFVVVVVFRDQIANFFQLGEKALRLFLVLVFLIFLSSFKIIPSILLEREIHFQKLIIPQIIESFIFNAILVILVLLGYGIDSYSFAFLVSAFIGIPFYYFVSPWKISFGIDKQSLKHLHFGAQFQAKNILAAVKDDLLTVYLAKTLSFVDLGYIGFGQRNAFFAYRFIVDNVTKVTFSTYARMQDDLKLLKSVIEKSLFLVSSAIFPLLFGLIIVAPYIILYFPKWQQKWEPAIISLTFFSLNAAVSSISGILVTVLDATGRVRQTLYLMILWTAATWIITPISISLFGYNGVAVTSFLITLTISITVYLVKKIVNFRFFSSIYKPLFCSVVMSVFVFLTAKMFVANFISLGIIIMLGAVVYISLMSFFAKEIREDIKQLIKSYEKK